jgi:hypothetical protein
MSPKDVSLLRKVWRDPGRGDLPWYIGPYFIMCCVLIAAVVLYPLAETFVGIILLRLLLTAILLSALYTVSRTPQLFRIMLVLLIPTLAANWTLNPGAYPALSILASSAILLILFAATAAILKNIITTRRVNQDIIFGSVAVYLLFGMFWALAFELLNEIMPGTVIPSVGEIMTVQERAELFPEFTYFSIITLTSVGYGDLAPISTQARALAMVEGMFGQLYVAILIAKLVGVQVAQE